MAYTEREILLMMMVLMTRTCQCWQTLPAKIRLNQTLDNWFGSDSNFKYQLMQKKPNRMWIAQMMTNIMQIKVTNVVVSFYVHKLSLGVKCCRLTSNTVECKILLQQITGSNALAAMLIF